MHVLLLADLLRNPAENPGGVQAVIDALAERLPRYPGIKISTLTCEQGLARETRVERNGIQHIFIPSPTPKIVTRVVRDPFAVARAIKAIRPDLIHSHLNVYTYAALKTGIPTVWTVHGITVNQKKDWRGVRGLARAWTYEALDRYCLKRVGHIIEISPYVREVFSRFTRACFHPIENPVATRFFEIESSEVPGRLLSVGSIEPRKGTLVLLQALRRLLERGARPTLHLVGRSKDDAYYREVRDFIDRHHLAGHVTLPGALTGEDLYREYSQAQVCVLASREETAPVMILEAMAAAKPVVATAVGGVPWLVRDGVNGFLVRFGDFEGLASRIELLLSDQSLCSRIGSENRAEASKRFRPELIAEKTFRVYLEVVGTGA